MSEWPTTHLSDLCDVLIGRTPRRDTRAYWNNGKHIWVTVAELDGGVIVDSKEHISNAALEIMPSPIDAGTLLFSFKLSIGKTGVAGVPLYTNEAIAALPIRRPDLVDRDYLTYALQRVNYERELGHSTKGKTLNKKKLASIELPLPPLPEQRRIVDILNRANGIRRFRREAQAKARQIIPTLFVEMFGDPVSNSKGWPVKAFGDLVERFEGGKNIQAGPENGGSPYRILKVSAVTKGYFRPGESKPAPTDYEPPVHHFVRPGDLLFSRANTVELVGATALVTNCPPNLLLPDKIWRIVSMTPQEITLVYALAFLQNHSTRIRLGILATGTSASMKNISQAKLRTLPTPVPPIDLQHAFAERVADIQALIAQQDRMAEASEELIASLMGQAFDGELGRPV